MVPFYKAPDSLLFLRQQLMASGKILERDMTMDATGCIRTVVTKFASEEDFLEFFYNPEPQSNFLLRRAYNLEHGIVEKINFYDGEGNAYYIDNKDPIE
jgi:hypothetical protein